MPEITSPSNTTQSTPKLRINRVHILIGVVLGAVLLGAGFGIYLLTQSKEETTATSTKVSTPSAQQATSSSTATPSADKDETADWETFTDDFFKISYNYPKNWEEKVKEEGVNACQPSVGPKNVKDSGFSICEFGQSSAEEIANIPDKSVVSMRENLTVTGKNVIRQVVTENNEDKIFAYIGNVNHKDQVGTLTVIGWPKGSGLTTEEFVELFDKILSTFKFLD